MAILGASSTPIPHGGPAARSVARDVSSFGKRLPIAALAAVGFGVAIWLTLYQWGLIGHLWDPFFDGAGGKNGSETVVTSEPSKRMEEWLHVPDGALGAVAYLADILFGLAGSSRRWRYRPWLVAIFGANVAGLALGSVGLVILQAFVIGHWCTLCLTSAAISWMLAYLSYEEVWATVLYLNGVRRRGGGLNGTLWRTFWGVPNRIADQVGGELAGPER